MVDSISSVSNTSAVDAARRSNNQQTARNAQEAVTQAAQAPQDEVSISDGAVERIAQEISQSLRDNPNQTLGLNADFEA